MLGVEIDIFMIPSSSHGFTLVILIPKMKKTEIVKHFEKEGIARTTIYNTINRMQNEESIKDKNKTGRPTSCTAARKRKLKRLVNNRNRDNMPGSARFYSDQRCVIVSIM